MKSRLKAFMEFAMLKPNFRRGPYEAHARFRIATQLQNTYQNTKVANEFDTRINRNELASQILNMNVCSVKTSLPLPHDPPGDSP